MDVLTRIAKARTKLLLDRRYVFWATIGLFLNTKENNHQPTMATDGEHLYYNKEFVEKLSDQDLMFVLAHEAGHCALGHHLRRAGRDPMKWNVAADFALNQLLVDSGLKPPDKILIDPKYKDMSAEQIYNLIKMVTKQMAASAEGTGKVDDAEKGKEEEQKHRWEVAARQAAQLAKAQGTLPGGLEHLIKPVKQKFDLRTVIQHLFSTTVSEDYTWAKPNKHHIYRGLYLPSQKRESTGDILIGIDVSGSVDDEQVSRFLGVVNSVLMEVRPRALYLVQCDAALQKWQKFERGEMLPNDVVIKGRGGTDMRPIWQWMKENNIQPNCAVICTDLYMSDSDFGEKQEFPVLWATCTTEREAPWGQTIKLEPEG